MRARLRSQTKRRRRLVLPVDEVIPQSDAEVGFDPLCMCINCQRTVREFPENQLPNTSDKYRLCRACNDFAWSIEGTRYALSA